MVVSLMAYKKKRSKNAAQKAANYAAGVTPAPKFVDAGLILFSPYYEPTKSSLKAN